MERDEENLSAVLIGSLVSLFLENSIIIAKLPLKYLFLVPIFMGVLWTGRHYCSHLFFRHLALNTIRSVTMANVHVRARQTPYSETRDVQVRLRSIILNDRANSLVFFQRTRVSDEQVPWSVRWPDYKPTEYTAPSVLKNPVWADASDAYGFLNSPRSSPDNRSSRKSVHHYNELDGKIDRRSFMGRYEVDRETNRPRNPQGRTGCMHRDVHRLYEKRKLTALVSGRGLLGRWGPNHAGDPVVTRWAKGQSGQHPKVLEIILISRRDTGELALPGGMVDAGYLCRSIDLACCTSDWFL